MGMGFKGKGYKKDKSWGIESTSTWIGSLGTFN